MSINLIVEKAGVAKGTFFHHFGDRARFLVALHRGFHDRLFAEITDTVAAMPTGRDRFLAAAATYLDGCLRPRGIRALLLKARAEPLIASAIAQRSRQVVRLITPDFAALGWADPADGAALWNALVVEVALLELADGERRLATRNALAPLPPGGTVTGYDVIVVGARVPGRDRPVHRCLHRRQPGACRSPRPVALGQILPPSLRKSLYGSTRTSPVWAWSYLMPLIPDSLRSFR